MKTLGVVPMLMYLIKQFLYQMDKQDIFHKLVQNSAWLKLNGLNIHQVMY